MLPLSLKKFRIITINIITLSIEVAIDNFSNFFYTMMLLMLPHDFGLSDCFNENRGNDKI